jgi:hypothetical protein
MNMKIGMTGTRFGLTEQQLKTFDSTFTLLEMEEFHHGDCVGADAEIANRIREIVREKGLSLTIISYPCTITKARAYTEADEIRLPTDPLDRNRLIVDSVDMMVAFPGKMKEQQRSGTWFTIRYARKQGVPLAIFWPDGTMTND